MDLIVKKNQSLQSLNTFGIKCSAKLFCSVRNEDAVRRLIDDGHFVRETSLILGGGSNVLFTKDFDGIVVQNEIKGIEVIAETDDWVYVQAGAGENWHEFVRYCIVQGWNGIENLSLIPGNVGASPMQNIGAYGVELKDVFHELEAIHMKTGEIHYFDNGQCEFGYRESIFKKDLKNQYLISRVTFRLSKYFSGNISYGAIQQELDQMKTSTLTAAQVSQAVINIRSSKLPDPKILGNAGSFFKNPVVDNATLASVLKQFPEVVKYELPDGGFKLAAGWLIEQTGWKGKKLGKCGVHDRQALVLVNHGGASGAEIYELSEQVLQAVKNKFGVELEREVNIY